METLDASSGLWNMDAGSGFHHPSGAWNHTGLDGYPQMLEDPLSDSDSSHEAQAYDMYFNPVNVEGVSEALLNSYASGEGVMALGTVPYAWTYSEAGQMSEVLSPVSVVTDSETSSAHGVAMALGDSSDDASLLEDDEESSEDSEESFSSGTTASTATNSEANSEVSSPSQLGGATSASGRPMRANGRGEYLRHVQDMLRQVNSAVEPAQKVGVRVKGKENPKKRSRVEPDLRTVTLTRDQLLTMTSEELDEFTARLKADHTLSAHEMRELKRQRRLIKNREYAQASRVKKKVVLSDLSVKFSDLETERTQLQQRVLLLEEENAALRAQLQLPPSERHLLPFMARNTRGNNNSNATHATTAANEDATLLQPPKAKRTARGASTRSSMAAIGSGLSLFAIVLMAIAVYSGSTSHFMPTFFNPTTTTNNPSTTTTTASNAMNFKSANDYSTFISNFPPNRLLMFLTHHLMRILLAI